MRDLLYPEVQLSHPDPVKRAQNAMARHKLPKRFYKDVSIMPEEGRFVLKLDGRTAKTPGGRPLALPTKMAASIVAVEWQAQTEVINPHAMPATKLVNTSLDTVAERMGEVAKDMAQFAASDLVCYRASEPEGLVALQDQHWNPVLTWAETHLNARFILAQGIIHAEQHPEAMQGVERSVATIRDPIALSALHVMTTISGSCLIALMTTLGTLSAESAWQAATVDEVWQASLWGWDAEAAQRHAGRRAEFLMAHGLFKALPCPPGHKP